jgi:hypothetical protein
LMSTTIFFSAHSPCHIAHKSDPPPLLDSRTQVLREKYSFDTIVANPPEKLLRLYGLLIPHGFHGFDKQGRPIYIQRTGIAHMNLVASFATIEQSIITHGYDMEVMAERARAQSVALGRNVESFVNIIDIAGLGMQHAQFLKHLQAIANLDQVCRFTITAASIKISGFYYML